MHVGLNLLLSLIFHVITDSARLNFLCILANNICLVT